MQIKRRLRINNIITALSVIAMVAVLLATFLRVNRAMKQNLIADALIAASFERLALRTDYIRTGSERAREQWSAKHDQISKLLKSASEIFTDAGNRHAVAVLMENQESIGNIVRAFVANRQNTGPEGRDPALSAEIEDRLLTQLNMRLYELVIVGGRLQDSSNAAIVSSLSAGGGWIAFVFLLMGAATLINSILTNRTIAARIDRLRDGASAIGRGNLDHRIAVKGDDEFAGLAGSFNEMTAKLSESYRDLEKEIEERKRTEEKLQKTADELRESEEKLSLALRSADMGVWRLDLIEQKRHYDDQVCRSLGIDPARFGGTAAEFYAAVHPDDRDRITAALDRTIKSGAPFEIEYRAVWPDGSIRHITSRGQLTRDAYGRPQWINGLVWDITGRKRAEEELRKVTERLESHMANSPLAIIEFDPSYRVVRWSGDAERIFGWKAEEVVGKPFSGIRWVYEEDIPAVVQVSEDMSTGRRPRNLTVNRNYRKDGSIIHCEWYNSAIYDEQGRMTSVLSQVLDITERKRAQGALLRLNKALKALSDSSQALIRARDESEYLDDVCGIVVEDCGYSMAWIGFAEKDEAKSVRAVACAGCEEGYLEKLRLTWADTERGRGPTGTAIRTGNVAMCRNMLTDPAFAPWREEAIKRGYASSVVFPLRSDARVFGAITMYSKEADPFTEDEVRLLTELTDNVAYGIGVLRIRAAQKKADETLRRYELLAGNSRDIILFIRSDDGRLVEVNAAATVAYGYDRDELLTMTVHDLRAPNTLALTAAQMAEADDHGILFETVHRRKDGRLFPAEVSSRGATIGGERMLISVVRDITERKQAEEALRQSEARLTSFARATFEGIVESEAGRIVDCNEQFALMLGSSVQELKGVAIADLIAPEDRDRVLANIRVNRDSVIEHSMIRRDGTRIITEAHGRPAFPGSVRRVTALRDITERKKYEGEILKLSHELAARNLTLEIANKELEAFVYSVSHDLRAPNRSVSGFAKILMEDYADKLDAQGTDYLTRIFNGAEKMSQRIEALLHLSRISRQDLVRVEIDLSSMASAIISDLHQTHPERDVEAVIAEGLVASADMNLIRVALSNLFENAWKFTSKTKNARIEFGILEPEARTAPDQVFSKGPGQSETTVFFVKDNGTGFDMAFADKMFWPFQRLHTDSEFPGTGIGLAIVERVIRRHGGRIRAEGWVGKGATFYFTLG